MAGQPLIHVKISSCLAGVAVLFGLYLAKLYNYLLFHTLVEGFSIVIACGIFVIAWNARHIMANNYLLFFGIASLFVGAVDSIHTLAYKGMGVFPGYDANLPTQLWIVARYLQCSALLLAPFFISRKLKPGLTVAAYLAVTSLLLWAVFSGAFPDCFIEGKGLTPFKKVSEHLVSLLLIAALVFMRRRAEAFDRDVVRLLSAGIGVFVASEFSFTLYTDVYGISNMVGHFLKFAGFFLVYKAIIETALTRPYDLLFRELKSKAAELENVNSELEAANLEMEMANQDLEDANRELEAVNQELEAFNYTVSHDLRSPLNNIYGSCQLLMELDRGNLDEMSNRCVAYIKNGVERMNTLINALLNFSRLIRQEPRREEVDLSELAFSIATELRGRQPERRVDFSIAEGARCNGDKVLLRAVMENLLGNAWKYTGKRDSAGIEFGISQHAGKPLFFVRDNGAGFDMGEAHRLFGTFQRLHDEGEFEGTGIGLATVNRIIQRHGGRIWAEAEPDKGATFYFTL